PMSTGCLMPPDISRWLGPLSLFCVCRQFISFRSSMLRELDPHTDFIPRHIGPACADQAQMLREIGADSLQSLIGEVVPPSILSSDPLNLPASRSEADALAELKSIAGRNQLFRNYIGQGYYGTHVPNV